MYVLEVASHCTKQIDLLEANEQYYRGCIFRSSYGVLQLAMFILMLIQCNTFYRLSDPKLGSLVLLYA